MAKDLHIHNSNDVVQGSPSDNMEIMEEEPSHGPVPEEEEPNDLQPRNDTEVRQGTLDDNMEVLEAEEAGHGPVPEGEEPDDLQRSNLQGRIDIDKEEAPNPSHQSLPQRPRKRLRRKMQSRGTLPLGASYQTVWKDPWQQYDIILCRNGYRHIAAGRYLPRWVYACLST